MSDVFAHTGEQVTTADGKPICKVKNALKKASIISAADFHEFEEGETPWKENDPVDDRCIRPSVRGGLEICINGEWRP